MEKQKDIYEVFNELESLLGSIDLKEESKKTNIKESNIKIESKLEDVKEEIKEEDILNKIVPEMTKVFFDEDKNPVVYEEESVEEKELINKIKDEHKIEKENLNKKETKKRKKEKKKKGKKWIITFGIFDVIAIVCLFLMYGPISYFRNLWVTSAMTTMTHQYLAYIFFNEDQINEIMSNNTIIEVEGNTNKEEININLEENKEEIIQYSSPEEEQVLKKDEGNDLYKVIDIEGNGYKGHMLVVYDPSKVDLVQSPSKSYGLTIEQFVSKNGAVAGINAGGFKYSAATGYSPLGVLIDDGVIYGTGVTSWGGGVVGFTNDNILVLTRSTAEEALKMGVRDAVSFGPFLIVNGVPSTFKGNGGYGIAPRTAIGQRKDGIVLMVVIDGRRAGHSLGVDMVELTDIMLRYGAYNASNLDGGGSSTLVVEGKTLSVAGGYGYQGDRYLPNAWLVRS